jgi:hypothetical protein
MGDLPDQFVVSNDHEQWTCRVVWRDRRFLGVRFVDQRREHIPILCIADI